jgi:hypothetical protein
MAKPTRTRIESPPAIMVYSWECLEWITHINFMGFQQTNAHLVRYWMRLVYFWHVHVYIETYQYVHPFFCSSVRPKSQTRLLGCIFLFKPKTCRRLFLMAILELKGNLLKRQTRPAQTKVFNSHTDPHQRYLDLGWRYQDVSTYRNVNRATDLEPSPGSLVHSLHHCMLGHAGVVLHPQSTCLNLW